MRDRRYYRRFSDQGPYSDERLQKIVEHRQRNRMFFGIGLSLVGAALLLRTMGILPYFSMQYSWPYVLVILGILIGLKNGFRNNAWWILILVGVANATPQFMIMGQPSRNFVWPALIMIGGLMIAFKPRRDRYCQARNISSSITSESSLNIDATFGGRKEVVTSKDFKGGVVSVTFAGCELNLVQADSTEQTIVLDCRVSFGGLEIAIPSHWEVQNEINPSFGSVEDERTIQTPANTESRKILLLKGSCSFGSIELKSY